MFLPFYILVDEAVMTTNYCRWGTLGNPGTPYGDPPRRFLSKKPKGAPFQVEKGLFFMRKKRKRHWNLERTWKEFAKKFEGVGG